MLARLLCKCSTAKSRYAKKFDKCSSAICNRPYLRFLNCIPPIPKHALILQTKTRQWWWSVACRDHVSRLVAMPFRNYVSLPTSWNHILQSYQDPDKKGSCLRKNVSLNPRCVRKWSDPVARTQILSFTHPFTIPSVSALWGHRHSKDDWWDELYQSSSYPSNTKRQCKHDNGSILRSLHWARICNILECRDSRKGYHSNITNGFKVVCTE